MAELEIELNSKMQQEFDRIQEAGSVLTPLYGPNYTGLKNLGNTSVSPTFTPPHMQQYITSDFVQSEAHSVKRGYYVGVRVFTERMPLMSNIITVDNCRGRLQCCLCVCVCVSVGAI